MLPCITDIQVIHFDNFTADFHIKNRKAIQRLRHVIYVYRWTGSPCRFNTRQQYHGAGAAQHCRTVLRPVRRTLGHRQQGGHSTSRRSVWNNFITCTLPMCRCNAYLCCVAMKKPEIMCNTFLEFDLCMR